MKNNSIFWDKKIDEKKLRKILKDDKNDRFISIASLLLSRTNEPKKVFEKYLKKVVFCHNWNKIKKKMRENKWSDKRIIFWDTIYNVAKKDFKEELSKKKKQPRKAINEDLRIIGDRIRLAREERNIKQVDLSEGTGYSQQTISAVENGYLNVSFLTLKNIFDALGLSIEIIGQKEHKEERSTSFTKA